MRSKLSLFCVLFLFLSNAQADEKVLSSYLFKPASRQALDAIALKYEITHKHGDRFEVIVPQKEVSNFLKLAPKAQLLEADIQAIFRMIDQSPGWLAGYHDYDSVREKLDRIVLKYPNIAKLQVYGKSAEGRDLFALKISDNVHQDENEVELMLTSSTHGDELISVEVVMSLIQSLIDGYGTDSRMTRFVDQRELWFVPVVNADGYVRRSRYTANGTDPNRAYPWPENPDRDPVPCIKKIMEFFQSRNFSGSIDFHASGQMIMYPWAYTYDPVDSFFERIMGDLVRNMANSNGYVHGSISKTIYVAKGSSADYYHWKNESIALAVEIGNSKVPHSSTMLSVVNENLESTWRFIEHF